MELPDFLIIPSVIVTDKTLQPLDGQVYGVIYWYTHQKLQKCIVSNRVIAQLLGANPRSIANSITRLTRRKYVSSIMDDQHHRIELIPNLSFTPRNINPSSNDDTPFIKQGTPPSSNDEHNKNNLIRKINKTMTNVIEEKTSSDDKIPITTYGNSDINDCMTQMKLFYPNMTNVTKNRYALARMLKKIPKERIIKAIKFAYDTREEEYAPVITNLIDLEKKWDKLEMFARRIMKERSGQYDKKRGIDARHL